MTLTKGFKNSIEVALCNLNDDESRLSEYTQYFWLLDGTKRKIRLVKIVQNGVPTRFECYISEVDKIPDECFTVVDYNRNTYDVITKILNYLEERINIL